MKIETYLGVDELRFGMLPGVVAQSMGPRDEQDTNYLGELIEYRLNRNLVTTYSQANGLVEVGFNPGAGELIIDGLSLFAPQPADVLRKVVLRDGAAMELAGFVVLRNLGITLSGFQDTPPSDLAVTAFARGRWDGQLAKMRSFTLLDEG